MSKIRKEKIVCPTCGAEDEVTVWDSLNTQFNPEEKQKLLDGTLFAFKCKQCGAVINLNYDTLYHDMENKAMIYLVPNGNLESSIEALKTAKKDTNLEEYRMRVVKDKESLQEKAMIFENGLDDRVIEIIKLSSYSFVKEKLPDAQIKDICIRIKDEIVTVLFLMDEPLYIDVPKSLYTEIKDSYAKQIEEYGKEDFIVDSTWAFNVMTKK